MKNMMLSAAAALVLSSVSLPTLAIEQTSDDCSLSGSCDLIVKATVADQCSCSFEGYYPTLDIGKLNKTSSVYGKTSPYPQSMYISCNTKYGGNLSAVSANNGLTSGGVQATDTIDYKLDVNGNDHGLASADFPTNHDYVSGNYSVSVTTQPYIFANVSPGMKHDTITFTVSPI